MDSLIKEKRSLREGNGLFVNTAAYPILKKKVIRIGTKKEHSIPLSTARTTVSSSVYFRSTGSVVSSLVAAAGAMQVQ